jgi:hypothetical protein
MACLFCQKKIGALRRLRGQHFCCSDHRKKFNSRSARAMREAEDLYGFDGLQSTTWRSIVQAKPDEKMERRGGLGTTIFVGLAIVFLLLAVSQVPVSRPVQQAVSPLPDRNSQPGKSGFSRMIGNLIQNNGSGTLREDFRSGFGNWEGFRSAGSDWNVADGEVRPTSLRIWTPSTGLSNYELEFMGQIEHKSLNWAFRASDVRNYYATKLIIAKPGTLPNAGLIRYIVLDGRERERAELPLPLTLERGVDYRVRVSVHGNRFLTSVNGQLISSWTDPRLSRGGVGFFAEDGESSVLKWVSVSERDSFLGRIASHFSLITFPSAAMAVEQ